MSKQLTPKSDKKMPPGLQLEKVDDRIMTLNVGPQHPGSGHMRLIIKVDGDYIVNCDPDPGYVHRGEEKMAEYRNYITNISSGKNDWCACYTCIFCTRWD